MRLLSSLCLMLLLVLTACTSTSNSSGAAAFRNANPDYGPQPKVKPGYETVYNCINRSSCESAARARCGGREPVNMSFQSAQSVLGSQDANRSGFTHSYVARFGCS